MPQRKEYDVYAGNQKVGEVWGHYDVFTEAERAEKRAKMVADLIMDDLAKDRIRDTEQYKAKEAKAERNFKIRKTIGMICVIASIALAVISVVFNNEIKSDSFLLRFVVPSIVFGLGIGLKYTDVEVNVKKRKPVISWGDAFYMFGGCGIGFFIADFIISFFIVKFVF
ncbi:MAG: hypothetical protein IJ447_07005 [Clostridia bacterium]|nr:hypothetical protein [Clostridia bacterium]